SDSLAGEGRAHSAASARRGRFRAPGAASPWTTAAHGDGVARLASPSRAPPAPRSAKAKLAFTRRFERLGNQSLVAPDVALDEAIGRPRFVDEHAVAADLDVEADRALHVEREHPVVAVAPEAGRDRQTRPDGAIVGAADVVDLGQLE